MNEQQKTEEECLREYISSLEPWQQELADGSLKWLASSPTTAGIGKIGFLREIMRSARRKDD